MAGDIWMTAGVMLGTVAGVVAILWGKRIYEVLEQSLRKIIKKVNNGE